MNAPTPAPADETLTDVSPFDSLLGSTIPGGWKIVSRFAKPGSPGNDDLSGSFFSYGFKATKGEPGTKGYAEAFLKVIDISAAMDASKWPPDWSFVHRMQSITAGHAHECSILEVCEKAKLDRIVQVLGKGELPPVAGMAAAMPVPYILFEIADGDVRKIVSRSRGIEDAWRLRVLHDVAAGINQLHNESIAHQDLKPSNILVFDSQGKRAKIGDLGRASRVGTDAGHDGAEVAGAVHYAPPEQVFGVRPERWEDRREGCDLYHLGTLLAFLFAGLTPTDHYVKHLPANIRPWRWGGNARCNYATALPLLVERFSDFVASVRQDFPEWARDELTTILTQACTPDYAQRGDPSFRARAGNPLGIEAFVSRFDRLAKKAPTVIGQ